MEFDLNKSVKMDNRKKSPLDVEYTSGGIFNAKKLSKHKYL